MKPIEFTKVPMKDVPDPPMGSRAGGGQFFALYQAIKALPTGEAYAIRVQFEGAKQLSYAKAQLRNAAKRDKIAILSSRNAESTLGWFWWGKPTN